MKKRYTRRQICEAINHWEKVLFESKITDLIEKNKWTKKDALKPENFKQLKQAWKKGDAFMKTVIDRIFTKSGKYIGSEKAQKEIDRIVDDEKAGKLPPEKEVGSDPKEVAPLKPDAKDKAAAEELVSKEEKIEKPIGDFNINTRLYRIHNGAVRQVREKLGQFLLKQKAGSPETVIATNSCVKEGRFEIPEDGKMTVTVAVKLDKAQLSGFGKMIALMKEQEDAGILDEGFFGDLVAGFKKGAKAFADVSKETISKMGETAKDKLETAHEKLKKNIGVESLKTYVTAFCGKKLGEAVNLKNISMNQDEEGTDGAEITFSCLINVK